MWAKPRCDGWLIAALLLGTLPAAADVERLSLSEVKLAAGARFDKLDQDADHTLDPGELRGVLGRSAFDAADLDHDGTLSKDEYLALVEKLFEKADVDHDGTLDVAELRSRSAHALRRLISAG